ncbi:acetate--CoA ligase family protein [Myxococcota bacterium]|nr:acetate--CoA ligase family protein [Myxococcota bacterium]
MSNKLDPIFRPRSVAVVGASSRRGTVGAEIFQNIIKHGYTGAVYPVNPKAHAVQSVRAYPSVGAIPEPVDMAVLVVPSTHMMSVVDECIEAGVKSLVIISAGFSETGEEGKKVQDEILEKVRNAGMRMVGPNCLGVLNTDPEVSLNATFAPTWPEAGGVAFLSQSGALGVTILDYAHKLGIGISQFASVGNKADVSGNDLVEYWENDPLTKVILLYLESFGNPRRFMEIARRLTRKKPVLVLKSGRSEAGARAASSHTGALAGLDVAVDALLGQGGVIRTDTVDELFDLAMLLSTQPVPKGKKIGILTNAGGPAIMASDACEYRGLQIPGLAPEVEAKLREILPAEAAFQNPVDMIAGANAESYEACLKVMLEDTNLDAMIVLFVPPVYANAEEIADAIRRASSKATIPVVTCFMGTHGVPAALSSLREGRLPSYAFPEAAALALSRATRYGEWLATEPDTTIVPTNIDRDEAQKVMAEVKASLHEGQTWMDSPEVSRLLLAYGIPANPTDFVKEADKASDAADKMRYPVALKLASETITHKSDVGGVRLNLKDGDEVREAFLTMQKTLRDLGKEDEMQGALVQEMAQPGGVEIFMGMTLDPLFGPLLGFGLGGTTVELWKDVAFRVHPLTPTDAREMMGEIRGHKMLEGFRGSPVPDKEALVDIMLRVSQLVGDFPEIKELDINPLLAFEDGLFVVDARIKVEF